jgi:archaellum component FlaF (FlaF/FlaG flagellin family)
VGLSADAADNIGVSKVEFLVNGTVVGTDTSSPYSISWDSTTSANGPATITARATDAANNATTSTARSVTVDNAAPTVSLTAPADGASVSGSITISADATDNLGVSRVQFLVNGTVVGTDSSSPYSISWDSTTIANGTATITARATDAANNATISAARTITVSNAAPDTTPPTVSLTAPANGATVSGTITISADASDNVGVSQVEFLVNGTVVGTDNSSPYSISWNSGSIANGSATITARARDAAGNATTSTARTVTVNNAGVTFLAVADAYVSSDTPASNFGTATQLRLDASPELRSYIKFDVQVGAPIKRAILRIFTGSASTIGYQVRGVASSSWGETTITFGNAPAVSSTVTGSSGGYATGVWTEVDVTSLVTGSGLVTIALTTTSNTNLPYSSREGANAPQLIVETG